MAWIAALLISSMACADVKPLVIYIGGAKSTSSQVQCWQKGAKSADSRFDFVAYPYPSGVILDHGSERTSIGKAMVNNIVTSLAAENRPIVVVGHSSGSDLANLLASQLVDAGKNVAHLYDLDGYGVPKNIAEKVPATCVTGHDSATGTTSLYWNESHSNCDLRDLPISGCGGARFCLHFRLTNRMAPAALDKSNYGSDGYSGCAPNLEWLKTVAPPMRRSEGTESTTSS